MLYPSRDSGINYRGIRTAPYMIRFLDALMNPIIRITHKEQLMELLVVYDVSINFKKFIFQNFFILEIIKINKFCL